jgi:hypothetical protein
MGHRAQLCRDVDAVRVARLCHNVDTGFAALCSIFAPMLCFGISAQLFTGIALLGAE